MRAVPVVFRYLRMKRVRHQMQFPANTAAKIGIAGPFTGAIVPFGFIRMPSTNKWKGRAAASAASEKSAIQECLAKRLGTGKTSAKRMRAPTATMPPKKSN